jgi:hypothetical protein
LFFGNEFQRLNQERDAQRQDGGEEISDNKEHELVSISCKKACSLRPIFKSQNRNGFFAVYSRPSPNADQQPPRRTEQQQEDAAPRKKVAKKKLWRQEKTKVPDPNKPV